MSDDDLIFLVDANSQLAEKELINRYMQVAKKVAKDYSDAFSDSGIPYEDFYAIAINCIHNSIHTYSNREVPFRRYWKVCVRNAIYDYVRNNSYRTAALPLSEVSLDDVFYKEGENIRFHDTVADNQPSNTIFELLYDYVSSNDGYFSKDEKTLIVLHYLEERTLIEFLEVTGWSRSKTYYIIKKARIKIAELLKDNYF